MPYVLLLKKTGKPLHISAESNGDAEDCGDITYRLTEYEDNPLYLVDNVDDALRTLCFDIGWYNSDQKHPMRGEFRLEDVEIAEMIVAYHKVECEAPLVITDYLDTRDIPYILARKFSAVTLDSNKKYVLVQIKKKTKLTLEELKKYISKKVYFGDIYNGRIVYGVLPAREEYADIAAFEMVCSLTA